MSTPIETWPGPPRAKREGGRGRRGAILGGRSGWPLGPSLGAGEGRGVGTFRAGAGAPEVSEHRCGQRSQHLEGPGGCRREQRGRMWDCILVLTQQAGLPPCNPLPGAPPSPPPSLASCSVLSFDVLLKLFLCYKLPTLPWAC